MRGVIMVVGPQIAFSESRKRESLETATQPQL